MFDSIKPKFLQKGNNEETRHLLSQQRIEDTGEHDKYKLVYWVLYKFIPDEKVEDIHTNN